MRSSLEACTGGGEGGEGAEVTVTTCQSTLHLTLCVASAVKERV